MKKFKKVQALMVSVDAKISVKINFGSCAELGEIVAKNFKTNKFTITQDFIPFLGKFSDQWEIINQKGKRVGLICIHRTRKNELICLPDMYEKSK